MSHAALDGLALIASSAASRKALAKDLYFPIPH